MGIDQNTYGPRGYRPLSERERAERASHTGGEPDLDFTTERAGAASTPYLDYHGVGVLLSLQHPRTDEPAELTFYMVAQAKELLFKLLFTEFNRCRDLLLADRLDRALWYLRRIERIQRVLVATWEPLSTITAGEFGRFRDQLGSASGLQSFGYRLLEFALGNKSRQMSDAHDGVAVAREQMRAALHSPSLYDAAVHVLREHGADIPVECVARDFAEQYRPHSAVEHAWAEVYRRPQDDHQLYLLAEALSDVGHQFTMWRTAHLLTVERILGDKPGTGATAGVQWLRRAAAHRFFPELWSARSVL